ncbi:MAG: hypothetical protein R8G66_15280 [Cytophagales bacterium]|nr:hypothetical protein [Cytophagales bacterium]
MYRLLFIALLWACQSPTQEAAGGGSVFEEQPVAEIQDPQEIPVPEGYNILERVDGDLDKDGIEEAVVAYNTAEIDEGSFKNVERDLIIYKQQAGKWVKWKSSLQALYGSRDGGMMGDPYDTMSIEIGILNIQHFGGSSWKWSVTDKYRYQDNELFLIGYTSTSGAPCEYFVNADFNVSTGKIIIEKEWENCDDENAENKKVSETSLVQGLKVTLQNRHDKRIHIVTPKEKLEVFVSTGPN